MFALNFDGWTSNLAPMLICVGGLLVSLYYYDSRLINLSKGLWRYCNARLKSGLVCLGLGVLIYLSLELLPWSTSFNPPLWMMIMMSAAPLLMGLWDVVGSIFGWDMRVKRFRFWYRMMLLHFVLVLALPVIWNS